MLYLFYFYLINHMIMDRKLIVLAAALGATGIILGAFGAHNLEKVLAPESLAVFETGVKYQMYHALFLLFAGHTVLLSQKTKKAIFVLVLLGVLFFSGSIYLLACDAILPFSIKPFGIITPIGGLLLICAWILVLINAIRRKG
jgi:uncharacterized membrane protein YgdD (TMEM256/DUF423 family)